MALTEIPVELSSTPGIADSSNATAITIDSSENVAITGNLSATKLTSNNGVLELDDNGTHNGVINVPASLFINIDSDNGATGEDFVIAKDRTSTSGGTELFRVQEDGNVGIGVTPEAYGSGYKALDIGSHAGIMAGATGSAFYLNENSYWDGSNFKAKNTAAGSQYQQTNGEHRWNTMASVSADANQTVTRVMTVDASGHVTMPLQPAFLVRAAAATNYATNTNHTVYFNNEVFDNNADFNDSTYTFTAPVTGRYQLNANMLLIDMPADCDYVYMTITCSNRVFQTYFDAGGLDQTSATHTINLSVLADMDASDTALINFRQQGGTAQTDLNTESYFSGYLVA